MRSALIVRVGVSAGLAVVVRPPWFVCLRRILGPTHSDLANTLHCVGLVYARVRSADAAIEVYEEVLRIKTTALGPNHPDVASALIAYGSALEQQERWVQVQQLFLCWCLWLSHLILPPLPPLTFSAFCKLM